MRPFQGHTVLSILICSVFLTDVQCQLSVHSRLQIFLRERLYSCTVPYGAECFNTAWQSASDSSLRPLGLMPYSWTWWSNSFYYQLSCSFEEESPWLLMRLETGDCWLWIHRHPLSGETELDSWVAAARPCGAGAIPSITALVGVDAGTGELCVGPVVCPPEVLGACALCDWSWVGRGQPSQIFSNKSASDRQFQLDTVAAVDL